MAAGQVLRVGEGAVGDQQPLHPGLAQVFGGQFDGLAGTDQQHGRVFQPRERILRQPHRGRGHRNRVGADAGIGTGALGHRERLLEQPVQVLADGAVVARQRPGVLDLAQDLRLAQHHRVQPGGNAEQVAHRGGVAVLVQIALQVAGVAFQPARQVLAVLGHGIQFGAVAGGQQHGFGQLRRLPQRVHRARQRIAAEGRAFAQFHRRGLMVQSEHPQGHSVQLLAISCWLLMAAILRPDCRRCPFPDQPGSPV